MPARNWLAEGLRALPDDAAAAWGRVIVPVRRIQPTDWERNTARLDGAEFVTANCFVRREVLADIGGFDERFTRPWREDSDLYFTLLERGCKVVSAPAAVVLHPVRQERPGISLRQHRNLYFDALLYKKHRRLYRQKIAAAPPLRYYATVAAMIACPVALLTGHFAAAAAAAALWLAFTVWMVLRRLRGTSKSRRHVLDMVVTSIAIPAVAIYWRLAGAFHFRVLFA
ncbi:MAG: glycosyltransferase family 2 protein [Zoogloea sp.]|nr:glycosyltransferase family 2 protein [Zoogloea sp.]